MRKSYNLIALGVVLLLSVGLAAAQTSAKSPQTPSAPPSQASPGAPNQGQATPPSQAAPSQSQGQSIDDELGLTQDQRQKIAAIVDDENKQISAIRDNNSLTLDQKKDKVLEVRQQGAPKIKAILTPEQLQKLAVIQERNRQQQSGDAPAPPKH